MVLCDDFKTNMIRYIDWQSVGVNFLEETVCVLDLCEKIIDLKPDIIIMDIRMPPLSLMVLISQLYIGNIENANSLVEMAGDVEMAKKILTNKAIRAKSDNKYSPEVIIVYNSQEFNYSPQAVFFGASNCLMKPFMFFEIKESVCKAVTDLENRGGVYGIMPYKISAYKDNLFNYLIKSTMKFIHENYKKELCLKDIASEFFISPNYLCTLFRKETNISLNTYLQKIRIEKAQELILCENCKKIYEIAAEVGFADYKYFFGIFKKYFYVTPGKYRREYFTDEV